MPERFKNATNKFKEKVREKWLYGVLVAIIIELFKDRMSGWANDQIDSGAGGVVKMITPAVSFLASMPLTSTIAVAVLILVALFIHSYVTEEKRRTILPVTEDDNPEARRRLAAFWRTCARDMLAALNSYFSTIRNQYRKGDGGDQLVGMLLVKYVFDRYPRLTARLDQIDDMTLEEQQSAISDVYDYYVEICGLVGSLTKRYPTNRDSNPDYHRWKRRDAAFTQNLSSILSDGRFPIIQARIGSVSTSDELGAP